MHAQVSGASSPAPRTDPAGHRKDFRQLFLYAVLSIIVAVIRPPIGDSLCRQDITYIL
jgi:hypothetical protein